MQTYQLKPGDYALALRLVIGWTYFSAFWRRIILENKLDPDAVGYIGEKFNHFLPNAILIKGTIEYLVSNPEQLWYSMWAFTIIEAIVGLCLMLGFMTRMMSIAVIGLAFGILLGSGWLGTTCLDEWQIGILGIAGGFTLVLAGGGKFSLDYKIEKKLPFRFLDSIRWKPAFVLILSLFIFGIALATNQVFHGGLWGKLHNKSVKPKVEIYAVDVSANHLSVDLMRVEGADVYGAFIIQMHISNGQDSILQIWDSHDLSTLPKEAIQNSYVAKVKPSKHSLLMPLGAKAKINLRLDNSIVQQEIKQFVITDISGAEWTFSR
ncbi:TQO small subunit DoxD [Sphingobacterium hungaricum]